MKVLDCFFPSIHLRHKSKVVLFADTVCSVLRSKINFMLRETCGGSN